MEKYGGVPKSGLIMLRSVVQVHLAPPPKSPVQAGQRPFLGPIVQSSTDPQRPLLTPIYSGVWHVCGTDRAGWGPRREGNGETAPIATLPQRGLDAMSQARASAERGAWAGGRAWCEAVTFTAPLWMPSGAFRDRRRRDKCRSAQLHASFVSHVDEATLLGGPPP